ncbi:hypothetical protein RFI_28162, partial [Reticulomyxa filosa]
EYTSLSVRANAHRLTPATSLARKLVTETELDDNDVHMRQQEGPNNNDDNDNYSNPLLASTMAHDFLKQQFVAVLFLFPHKVVGIMSRLCKKRKSKKKNKKARLFFLFCLNFGVNFLLAIVKFLRIRKLRSYSLHFSVPAYLSIFFCQVSYLLRSRLDLLL